MSLLVKSVNIQSVRSKTLFVHGGVAAAKAAVVNILLAPQITEREIETHQMVGELSDPSLCTAMHQGISDIGVKNRIWTAGQIITRLQSTGNYETGCLPGQYEEGLGMPAKRISIYALGSNLATCSFQMDFGPMTGTYAAQQGLAFGLFPSINVNVELLDPSGQISLDLGELAAYLPFTQEFASVNYDWNNVLLAQDPGSNLAVRLEFAGLTNRMGEGQVITADIPAGQTPVLTFAVHNPAMITSYGSGGYILPEQEETAMSYAQTIARSLEAVQASAEAIEAAMQDAVPSTPETLANQPIHPSILANDAKLRQMFITLWQNRPREAESNNPFAVKLREIIQLWEKRGYIDPKLTDSYKIYELVGNAIVKVVHELYPTKEEANLHFFIARYLTLANTLELFKESPSAAFEEMTAILLCVRLSLKQITQKHPELRALKEYITAHPAQQQQYQTALENVIRHYF